MPFWREPESLRVKCCVHLLLSQVTTCRRNHRQLVPFGPLPLYGRSQMDDDGDERHPKQSKGGAAAAGEVGSEVFCL